MKLAITTKKLKELIMNIYNISNDCILHITSSGISCAVVSRNNIELIKVKYPVELFEQYNVDIPIIIALELDQLLRKINKNKPLTVIDLYPDKEETPTILYLDCNGFLDKINLLNPTNVKKEVKLPITYGNSKVILPTQRMIEILNKSKYPSKDRSLIELELKNGMFFTKTTEIHPTISVSEPIFFSGDDVKVTYAIEPLLKLCKLIKSESMTINFKTDHPIHINYTVLSDGIVNYYLAPRVG